MAALAHIDGVFTFNSFDASSYTQSFSVQVDGANLEHRTINSAWAKGLLGGKAFSLAVTFVDDFADNALDETIWSAFNTGTNVTWSWKASSASTSASNPLYSGTVVPMFGGVGGDAASLLGKTITFPGSGTLTRAVS